VLHVGFRYRDPFGKVSTYFLPCQVFLYKNKRRIMARMSTPIPKDAVDEILEQWTAERPELDTASLGVVIRIMSLYRAFLRQATSALEEVDLELFEYDVLSALRRQGSPFALPATALARATGLSSGAMTNRVDKLETRGLVRRQRDEHDRRGVVVSLTARGRRKIDAAIQLRLDVADESLADMSSAERGRLADLLRKVCLAAEED
jgi:DNA-binding MarR family transcriptional regulator